MSKWHTRSCDYCGADIFVHEDWSNPPTICKACKEQYIEKTARKKRKKRRAGKPDDVIECIGCGCSFKVDHTYGDSYEYCTSCKEAFPPSENRSCDSCGKGFVIPVETVFQYKKNGWNLPRRCTRCQKWCRRWGKLEDSERGSRKTEGIRGSRSFFSAIDEGGFEPKGLPTSGGLPSLGKKQ